MASSGRHPRAISNVRPQPAARTDRTLILNDKIWIAKLRIDRVVIFQASAPRIFNAVALIDSVAVADSAVIASVVVVDLAAAATVSVAAGDLGAVALAALADSAVEDFAAAVAGSGAGDDN